MGRYRSDSCAETVFGAMFSLAICGAALVYAAEYLHRWIPGVPIGVLALVLPLVVFLGYKGYVRYAEYREQTRLKNQLCPHGVKGGKTLGLCELCLEEEREAKRKLDAEREQLERKRKISEDAKRLRNEELVRLEQRKVKSLEHLHSLHPREFEDIVATMYRNLGYEVRQTPYSNDGGKDAIAEKDGIRYVIECKRYGPGNPVGRPAIQKFSAAVVEQKGARGIFVTTGRFTETAVANAIKHGIELVDGNKLVSLMREAFPEHTDDSVCRVMCQECGDIVYFPLGVVEKECAHGHLVKNDLLRAAGGPALLAGKKLCERCGREMMDAESERRIVDAIPLRRLGSPRDIADTILFLASERASWLTGQVIKVSGGHAL